MHPNCQSFVFDSTSSFLSPDAANTVANPIDTAATLARQRANLKAANDAADPNSAMSPGPVSAHFTKLRSAAIALHKIYSLSPGRPVRRGPTFLSFPPHLFSVLHAPIAVPLLVSVGFPPSLAIIGRVWWISHPHSHYRRWRWTSRHSSRSAWASWRSMEDRHRRLNRASSSASLWRGYSSCIRHRL